MKVNLRRTWAVVTGGEVVISLAGQATGIGGVSVAFIADLPNWVGIGAVIGICGTVMVLSQAYVLARVVTRIEEDNAKQRASFSTLWETAHSGELSEQGDKLNQLWEDFYGSPHPSRFTSPNPVALDANVPKYNPRRRRR